MDEDEPESPQQLKKRARLTEAEKEARRLARQAAKEERDRSKNAAKESKRLEKEEKAKEKQLADDIATVNTRNFDRKKTTQNMIIDISTSLLEARLGDKIKQYMIRHEVECKPFISDMPDLIKWRRKNYRVWNEEANRFSPRPEHIVNEAHVLCYLHAKTLNELVSTEPSDPDALTLDTHVLKLKFAHHGSKPIYLIEGLQSLIASARNAKNREHQALVLQQIPGGSQESSSQPPRRRAKPAPIISEDTIEDALVSLQLHHKILVYHTNTPDESAEWIMQFTQHISTIPEKMDMWRVNSGVNFSFETVEEKADEPQKIWELMLQTVGGVKIAAAEAIRYKYGDAGTLSRAFRDKGTMMLENVKV
jgi:crossover junction endonuclease EME1